MYMLRLVSSQKDSVVGIMDINGGFG